MKVRAIHVSVWAEVAAVAVKIPVRAMRRTRHMRRTVGGGYLFLAC